jgi:hypothetical protein
MKAEPHKGTLDQYECLEGTIKRLALTKEVVAKADNTITKNNTKPKKDPKSKGKDSTQQVEIV